MRSAREWSAVLPVLPTCWITGKPKSGYPTLIAAAARARRLWFVTGEYLQPYYCECGKYHVGHPPDALNLHLPYLVLSARLIADAFTNDPRFDGNARKESCACAASPSSSIA